MIPLMANLSLKEMPAFMLFRVLSSRHFAILQIYLVFQRTIYFNKIKCNITTWVTECDQK